MRRRAFSVVLLAVAVLLALCAPALAVTPKDWSKDAPGTLDAGHLYSQASVLIDARSGEVLFDKSAEVRMYPASTTKIMTLLLALESEIALDEVITIPDAAKNVPGDSTTVPVTPGEQMTFRDLLYGTMMRSGNDGSNAIAVLVSGSLEAFVASMNERAGRIGCENTHFANAHGYHDEMHYSTALDLAKIAQEAMKNATFREIVSTQSYVMAPTANRGEYTIETRIDLLKPENKYYYEWCVGVKTGKHSKAGNCFVGAARRGGALVISVVLNSSTSNDGQKWADTAKLFEYAYTKYDRFTLAELYAAAGRDINTVSIENAAKDDPQKGLLSLRLAQVSVDDYARFVLRNERSLATATADFAARAGIDLNPDLRAPIDEGEILGTLTYASEEGEKITAMLTADRAVEARPEYVTVYDVLPFLRPLEPFIASGAATYVLVALIAAIVALAVLRTRRRVLRNRRRQRIYDIKRREYNRMQAERQARRRKKGRRPPPRSRSF